jgi:plasmid replication initiation protein
MFELEHFRQQLGLSSNELFRMSDFKKRVLDLAVSQINKHTDISVTYEQVKSGRIITGFTFVLTIKDTNPNIPQKKKPTKKNSVNDIDTLLKNREWVSRHAQVGESWEDARTRLRREAATGKFSLAPT